MSDTDSDSEVQINIRPNRNNIIRDESLDEGPNYESQNEQDFEHSPLSNLNVDVSSPLDLVRINTSQSEPSDTVAYFPRSQGRAALVDIPGRHSPPFNVGILDQHSNATHPQVDIPGRHSTAFSVDNPDQHSNATYPRVDIPGRRSPTFNVGIPDQHSNATHPLFDIPGRRQRSPAFNVGIPDQHSNVTHPQVDIPGRRSPPYNVGIPDQHSNVTHPQVDIPGRRSPPYNVGIPDQHSNATHPLFDIPGRRQRSPAFNVGIPDQHSNVTHPQVDIPGRRSPPYNVGIPDQHSNVTHPLVDIPGRRQRSPAFNVGNPDQHSNATYPQVDNPGRRVDNPGRRQRFSTFSVDNPDQHSVVGYPRVDNPGRLRRSLGFNVAFQEQHSSYHEIPVRHLDRYPDESSNCEFDLAGRSRASNRYEPANCRNFCTHLGCRSSTGIGAATRRTFSRDRENPGPVRRTGSPSPHYYRPRRRSRPKTRNFRDKSKRFYSPYGRRHHSFDFERPSHSPGRGDMNHSNMESMTISRGMPEYREQSPQWPGLCPEPYNNNPYDTQSDYKQCRPRMEFEDKYVHYPPSYQSEPRIKPDPYTGSEDWEEYQSYFEDCAELSRWDPRSKALFLAASFKGQARTYYMSLDACDKRSYWALVYKMRQRFGSNKHALKWLNQLELRQRKPEESIVALGDDLRQLARKAYRDLDTHAQETLALNQLYKLIPVEMKCRCMDHDCQSIHQAVEVIERYEAILGEAGQDRKKISLRSLETDYKTEDQNNEPSVAGILRKLDSRLEKLESLSLVQQITGRENIEDQRRKPNHGNTNKRCCFFCSLPDHLVKNCPEITCQGSKPRYQGQSNGAFQGNSVPQNSAWQVPQYSAQQMSPQHFPLQLPPFNFPPQNVQENGKLSAQ